MMMRSMPPATKAAICSLKAWAGFVRVEHAQWCKTDAEWTNVTSKKNLLERCHDNPAREINTSFVDLE